MSGEDIIRNPYEIDKFADSVEDYEQKMKTICNKMQGDLDNATGAMLDETGLAALTKLSDIVEDILAALPNADALQHKLRKVSKYGKEYLDVKY